MERSDGSGTAGRGGDVAENSKSQNRRAAGRKLGAWNLVAICRSIKRSHPHINWPSRGGEASSAEERRGRVCTPKSIKTYFEEKTTSAPQKRKRRRERASARTP